MSQITHILERLNGGEKAAFDELVPLVYQELRRRAARRLSGRSGDTLQATALVNEAFVRLLSQRLIRCQDSRHFYNAAAEAMRQIVMNHARSRAAQKRGGGLRRVELECVEPVDPAEEFDWEALDVALAELREMDERRYQVVMLRYFAGLTDAQIAVALDVAEKTVERDWAAAKTFLRSKMCEHA